MRSQQRDMDQWEDRDWEMDQSDSCTPHISWQLPPHELCTLYTVYDGRSFNKCGGLIYTRYIRSYAKSSLEGPPYSRVSGFRALTVWGGGKDQALATFWAAGAVSLQQAFQVTLQALVTHCTALHCTALHCTALTALHCFELQISTLPWTFMILYCNAPYCTALIRTCDSLLLWIRSTGFYLNVYHWLG